ncbi:MAG: prepilin-type N-terminal cleavage/methylation domain-containing protein [Sumerlaeia bacterium]
MRTEQTKKPEAFTLIELLIVVAIIAILAAIAVPNFLEAQVRAKVSRVKSDIRSIATAVESYAVDNNNKYPFDIDSRGWPWYMTDVISTPIAYLTSGSILEDPFRVGGTGTASTDARRFRYINYMSTVTPGWPPSPYPGPFTASTRPAWAPTINQAQFETATENFGLYKLSSAGPDQSANTSFLLTELIYDPTNGTVSGGDVIRSQKGQSE